MLSLMLTATLSVTMPPPAWIEADPMPPPAVTAPEGIIDTIRQAKALIGKGNALADRGKLILDAAQRDGKIRVDVHVPEVMPDVGLVIEKPPPKEAVTLITPTRPPVVARVPGPRNLFRCPHCGDTESGCDMFLGESLLKLGVKRQYLEEVGHKQWGVLYDNIINSRPPVVAVQSGCEGGVCPIPRRRILFPRLGRR